MYAQFSSSTVQFILQTVGNLSDPDEIVELEVPKVIPPLIDLTEQDEPLEVMENTEPAEVTPDAPLQISHQGLYCNCACVHLQNAMANFKRYV